MAGTWYMGGGKNGGIVIYSHGKNIYATIWRGQYEGDCGQCAILAGAHRQTVVPKAKTLWPKHWLENILLRNAVRGVVLYLGQDYTWQTHEGLISGGYPLAFAYHQHDIPKTLSVVQYQFRWIPSLGNTTRGFYRRISLFYGWLMVNGERFKLLPLSTFQQ